MGAKTDTGARIRVVIANSTFVKGAMVRHRLEKEGFDVVTVPADEVVEEVRLRQPDAVVLDRSLIEANAADAIPAVPAVPAIRGASPTTKIVLVGPLGATPIEGADGYLGEEANVESLSSLLIDICGEPTIVLPEAGPEGETGAEDDTVPMAALLAGEGDETGRPRRDRRAATSRALVVLGVGIIVAALVGIATSGGGGETPAPAAASSPSANPVANPEPTTLDKAYATLDELVAALRTGSYVEAKVDAQLLMDQRQQAWSEGFALLGIDAAVTDALTPIAPTLAPRVVVTMEDILGALWPVLEPPAGNGGDGNIVTSGGTSTGSSTGSSTGGSGAGTSTGDGTGGGGTTTDTFPGQGKHAGWSHKPPEGGWHGHKPK